MTRRPRDLPRDLASLSLADFLAIVDGLNADRSKLTVADDLGFIEAVTREASRRVAVRLAGGAS